MSSTTSQSAHDLMSHFNIVHYMRNQRTINLWPQQYKGHKALHPTVYTKFCKYAAAIKSKPYLHMASRYKVLR